MKVSPEKLNHFLTFINNQYVMQDLPFGEKTLKLSSNPEIKVPNVLRTMVLHLIVQQYHSHCQETGFVSMRSTTPRRILKSMCANPFKDLIMSQQRVQKRLKNQQMSSKTKCQPPRQRPLMAKRPEQSCWFELFSDTLFATLLETHVSPSSRSLSGLRFSYQSDPDFVSTCDHEHNLRCEDVSEIESALESVDTSNGAKDQMKYVISMANKKSK
ncbi:unnamed protein product [Porites lobata]|uniref:Uncharacterized protein n=1 Tax=Porites lobata TaxID=104759 RepID=A0ABN8N9K0_9CNID|nr:unnamed protein product [Porites lobata]